MNKKIIHIKEIKTEPLKIQVVPAGYSVNKDTKEKKITVRHFLNTNIISTQVIDENKSIKNAHPVYIQVVYNRKTYTFKSRFFDFAHFYCDADDYKLENDKDFSKSDAENEKQIITFIIREFEKNEVQVNSANIRLKYSYYTSNIITEIINIRETIDGSNFIKLYPNGLFLRNYLTTVLNEFVENRKIEDGIYLCRYFLIRDEKLLLEVEKFLHNVFSNNRASEIMKFFIDIIYRG